MPSVPNLFFCWTRASSMALVLTHADHLGLGNLVEVLSPPVALSSRMGLYEISLMHIRPECLLLNNVTRHDGEATHMKSQQYLCLHRNYMRPYQLTWQCRRGDFAMPHLFIFFSLISSCFPVLGSSGLGHNLHLVWSGQIGCSYPLWICRTLQDCPSPVHSMFTLSLIQTITYSLKDGSPLSHAYLHTPVWHKMVLWGDFFQNILPTSMDKSRKGDRLWKQSPRTFPHHPSERWSFLR